jgi:hypothetical protein
MVDRTFLPFWKVSIAAHLQWPEHRAQYLEAEIERAPSEKVRRRIMRLKHQLEAGETRGEGRVLTLRPCEVTKRRAAGRQPSAAGRQRSSGRL